MTATDANRFAIRLAREATKRKKILVFNGCYHGSVDETLVDLKLGLPVSRRGNIGPPVDPQVTTKVIEFNDIESLDNALSPQDVAAVVCEPAMTNRGIILPEPNYHETLRLLTRRYGALLIVDETHTICCGPGGYTAEHNLDPDIVTIGKPIASGVPGAAYGISQEVANKIISKVKMDTSDESGIGGTLSGNALAVAAIKATLEHVITKEAFDYMVPLAERFADGIERTIKAEKLPWHVTRLGVRVEYAFRPTRPKNGGEAEASKDPELDKLMHVYALNRGILLTPFHNMALISPYHSIADVDFHTKVFQECVLELTQ
jgi:glutamate-1-semialdehyde 2,1-aminomutase